MPDVVVRRARPADLPQVAALAGRLVRLHHGFDPPRFLLVEPIEEGYSWYFSRELKRREAVILVAARNGGDEVLGYAYGTLEPRNWNDLLDTCGKLHDLYVDEAARGQGHARALVGMMLTELRTLGAPRVVLLSAAKNTGAQAAFAALGFRPTMVEMTRELDDEAGPRG